MRGVFDDRDLEPTESRRDTELTLGSGTLLALFFGLVLLCGLCFGLGYAVGHRTSPAAYVVTAPSGANSQPVAGGSVAKPSATEQPAPNPLPVASQPQPSTDSGITPAADAQTLPAPVPSPAAPAQPQIHLALTPAVVTTQSGQPAPASTVRPAFAPPAGSFMVQVASVSNAEDAEVLTNALRRRGYTVAVRREPADNLIHVRVGPFATLAEANSWRMKLLNDGYNALVQP